MFKKIKEFLFDDDTMENNVEEDKILANKPAEIVKPVALSDDNILRTLTEEEKMKQLQLEQKYKEKESSVIFVDDVFDKPKPKSQAYPTTLEKKFKPRPFISPVHGVINEEIEDPVQIDLEEEVYEEKKMDYEQIRERAFGSGKSVMVTDSVEVKDFVESTSSEESILFKTQEIVNIKKRMQVDTQPSRVIDDNLTLDEAFNAVNGEDVELDINKVRENEQNRKMSLLDLLDDLGEDNE